METPENETIPVQMEPVAPAPESSGLRTFGMCMRDLVLCILISFFIIVFVYQPVKVEGGSMEPGLEDQERIVINKLVYRLESIERGDRGNCGIEVHSAGIFVGGGFDRPALDSARKHHRSKKEKE